MLSELDTSINLNVIFSRLKPIPIARDSQTANRVDTIINDLLNGKIKTILQDFDISDLVAGNGGGLDTVELTNVENSRYIQYLQHLHDSLISRLYFMMGLSISDNGKQAQISIDELNKSKSASLSIIESWYKARENGYKQIENKTGVKLEFDFGDLWKTEVELQEMNEEEKQEEFEDESFVNTTSENEDTNKEGYGNDSSGDSE